MSALHSILSRERLTAADMEEIHTAHGGTPGFVDELIRLIPLLDPEFTARPLRLLQLSAEAGGLDQKKISRVVAQTDAMTHWLARLLFGQLLSATGCPPDAEDDAFPYLADCFEDRRVIVRAWALTALAGFTSPHHQKAIASMFALAQKDPAKSMQARLRQLPSQKRFSRKPRQ